MKSPTDTQAKDMASQPPRHRSDAPVIMHPPPSCLVSQSFVTSQVRAMDSVRDLRNSSGDWVAIALRGALMSRIGKTWLVMIYVSKGVRAGLIIAVTSVLGWLGGCSDVPTFVPPPSAPPPPPIAIVSDTAQAAGFASGPVEASVQQASAADEVVYVSLTPGTVPGGATATIRRVGGAASLVTTLSNGGFDPVPVQAQTNDSIEVAVRDAGGATIGVLRLSVTPRRPPIVVRTNPRTRRTTCH